MQTPTRTAEGKPRHLYEVDVLRILTFACVIGVHTTSHTAATDDVGLNALLALLHFTRLVFFSLTAFVLVYSYTLRPRPMAQFWPKRFLLVGVPYLAWSFVYVAAAWLLSPTRRGDVPDLVRTAAEGIVTGTSWYHLYFLLVTMQVYLLLPVIVWLVRRTRGHHVPVLVVALLVQLVVFAGYKYFPASDAWMQGYQKQFFFSYVFFIVSGRSPPTTRTRSCGSSGSTAVRSCGRSPASVGSPSVCGRCRSASGSPSTPRGRRCSRSRWSGAPRCSSGSWRSARPGRIDGAPEAGPPGSSTTRPTARSASS
ncbi:acyltransferase family protein [Curtobacterium flaccumfaciens pv. flaccumfaciens]|uniref:acyltransferase n=1 Tax=Curtobacterium flaccumfaciens TaxID=2035 RepID=UPI0036F34B79|nr:acyltransferase family protein [Curtobacterium flaccumfaciens pv. flaccumfaciens]